MKKNIDWVVVSSKPGEIAFCKRCGKGLNFQLPQRCEIVEAALNAFTKIHSECQPGNGWSESVKSPYEWLMGRDTGISSRTIYAAITGCPTEDYDIPHDPDDFGRCYRLLELFPNWKAELHKVAERFPKWKPFIAAWDELTALYEEEAPSGRAPKLFDRMQELRREA